MSDTEKLTHLEKKDFYQKFIEKILYFFRLNHNSEQVLQDHILNAENRTKLISELVEGANPLKKAQVLKIMSTVLLMYRFHSLPDLTEQVRKLGFFNPKLSPTELANEVDQIRDELIDYSCYDRKWIINEEKTENKVEFKKVACFTTKEAQADPQIQRLLQEQCDGVNVIDIGLGELQYSNVANFRRDERSVSFDVSGNGGNARVFAGENEVSVSKSPSNSKKYDIKVKPGVKEACINNLISKMSSVEEGDGGCSIPGLESLNDINIRHKNDNIKDPIEEIEDKDVSIIRKGTIMRSYGTSLKADWLNKPLTEMMRRRQVLKFLYEKGSNFAEFLEHTSLSNASEDLIEQYRNMFEEYYPLRDLEHILRENKRKIDTIKKGLHEHRKKGAEAMLQLSKHFNEQALKVMQFLTEETPLELIDYLKGISTLNFSFNDLKKTIQQHFNGKEGKYLEITVKKHLQPQLKNMRKTIEKISNVMEDILEIDRLRSVSAIYLTFGQIPDFLCNHFSKRWKGLKKIWVRSSMVGWRRKLDSNLLPQLQLEVLPGVFHKFGNELRRLSNNEDHHRLISTLEKRKVLHLLSENIDLTPLLKDDQDLFDIYLKIRRDNRSMILSENFKKELIEKKCITRFTLEEITAAADEQIVLVKEQIKNSINQKLQIFIKKISKLIEKNNNYDFLKDIKEALLDVLKNNFITYIEKAKLIKDIKTRLKGNLQKILEKVINYQKSQTFINQVTLVKKIILNEGKIKDIIPNNYVLGSHFSKSVARLLEKIQYDYEGRNYSQLYTALRGIVSLAYANKYDYFGQHGVALKLSGFDAFKVVTFPFQSVNRNKTDIPFHSTKDSPLKPKNAKDGGFVIDFKRRVTQLIKKGEPVFVQIPFHSNLQIMNNGLLKEGTRTYNSIILRLMPTPKILECINNGAQIQNIVVLEPKAPFKNIKVQVNLSAKDRVTFKHRRKFIDDFDKRKILQKIYPSNYLGIDFNAVGKFMIAVGTPNQEIDVTPLTENLGFEKAKAKFEVYDEIISKLQTEIIEMVRNERNCLASKLREEIVEDLMKERKEVNENNILLQFAYKDNLLREIFDEREFKIIRSKRQEITLLHNKRKKVFKNLLIKVVMVYTYIGSKTEATYYGWDDISNISTKGRKGKLATAISYLPRKDGLKGLFAEWAEDLGLVVPENIREIDARTSKYCGECRKKTMKPYNGDYHTVICSECGHIANRHSNSARVESQALENKVKEELILNTSLDFSLLS